MSTLTKPQPKGDWSVDVLDGRVVRLGDRVVCDAWKSACPYRVQTHIHDDHMADFETSTGFQDLMMSPATFELLVAERNAALPYRDNIHPIPHGEPHDLADGSILSLQNANHMLGSSQVALTLPDGLRVGYSGDFGWPLDSIIEVDELVVDSTYGSPASIRPYSQGAAEAALLDLVLERLRHGPVHVVAFRGTIERVIQLLAEVTDPIFGSEALIRTLSVYRKHGLALPDVEDIGSDTGRHAQALGRYVRLYTKGDALGNAETSGTKIVCRAFSRERPVETFSDRSHRVGLSNHADFEETMAFIEGTGARRVVTDNTRAHGVELAFAIRERWPHVEAKPRPYSV